MSKAEDELVSTDGRRSRSLRGAARCFRRSDQGVTAIEFALVFPVMLILLVALVEFGEAFSVGRKINNAASTASDLVSQESAVTDAELDKIRTIARELVKPYRTAPLILRITSVVADNQVQDNVRKATVEWSYGPGARAVNSVFPLPQGKLTEPNSSLIITETSYAFTPSLGYFIGDITLNGIAYFRPRVTRTIPKTN
jgi:Flp pilus assembly protein TadG